MKFASCKSQLLLVSLGAFFCCNQVCRNRGSAWKAGEPEPMISRGVSFSGSLLVAFHKLGVAGAVLWVCSEEQRECEEARMSLQFFTLNSRLPVIPTPLALGCEHHKFKTILNFARYPVSKHKIDLITSFKIIEHFFELDKLNFISSDFQLKQLFHFFKKKHILFFEIKL